MKKRILKWVIGILLTPIILFFISATLLYLPPIQDFAVRKATAYLSETTGMKVHIGRLRLTFLFDIDLQDVQIIDGQDDSLLDVERLSVDLSFASLLHGEIDVEGIELTRAAVNTKSMIAGVEIKGSIGRFFVNSHGIEIPQEMVTVNTALLSDADVDGYQIRTLVLTMLYRLTPTLINKGYVYIAESPLYEINTKNKTFFAYTEPEKADILRRIEGEKYTIQRSKGLGENDPEMMWLTTMSPESRRLIKVLPTDAERTAAVFDLLLGDNLQGRKEHIAEHGAEYLDDLDVS